MPRSKLHGFIALSLVLLFLPAALVSAQPAERTEVNPEQARQVLDTLQDDERREEVLRTFIAEMSPPCLIRETKSPGNPGLP